MAEKRARVLIVDDRKEMAETLADGLRDRGYDAVSVGSGTEALERLARERVDALVTDLRMPGLDGLQLLAASRAQDQSRPVIIMTAFGAIDSAVESIRQGAAHYLTKPFKLDELVLFLGRALDEVKVRREASALKTTLRERFASGKVLGKSSAMLEALEIVERVAPSDAAVLLLGETGTGKGLFARTLHAASARAAAPFIAVNCAALPESLLESELFGHVKGAFTSAAHDRHGLFAQAHGGTLFLDEVGEIAPQLQAKLLHAVESRSVRPIGGQREVPADVRLISATHRDLRACVAAGTFREDLLYRLEVVSVMLPPLRHRREDLPELIDTLLRETRARHPGSPVQRLSAEALQRLLDHSWPGNVRELQHALERLVLLAKGAEAQLTDLPPSLLEPAAPRPSWMGDQVVPIRELQRRYAAWALERMAGHRGHTAEALGVDGKTLAKWLEVD